MPAARPAHRAPAAAAPLAPLPNTTEPVDEARPGQLRIDHIIRGLIVLIVVLVIALPVMLWSSLRKPQPATNSIPIATLPRDSAPRDESLDEESLAAAPGAADSAASAAPHADADSTRRDHAPPPIITRQTTRLPDSAPAPNGPPPVDEPVASDDPMHRGAHEREERVKRFGGTVNTENAVEAGIIWLAAHQSPDGTWDRFQFERMCPSDDKCGGPAILRTQHALHAGVTGLALLAFLGAGYTDRSGPYQKNVGAGVAALLRLQRPDGGFSATPSMAGYNDSVGTFALAEYYALTRNSLVEQPLRRAVEHLAQTQQPLGGWDYLPDSGSGRNDTSITGWAVQALRAAAAAGIPTPRSAFVRAALHIARATQRDGHVWYADSGEGFGMSNDLQPQYRYGPAMTAVGLTCAPLLGWRLDAPIVRRQQALLLGDAPNGPAARGKDREQLHSEYYWYYGTIAMFQAGGDEWDRWNGKLRDAILPLQDRRKLTNEKKHHSYGSWAPYGNGWGKWGRMGSRVYTTAICTLTLEIYYRHTPAFLEDDAIVHADDWREYLAGAATREKLLAAYVLRDSRFEIGEPVLVEMLGDADDKVALAAATALAAINSPLGADVLARVLPTLSEFDRGLAREALGRIDAVRKRDKAAGRVRFFDPQTHLGTAELSNAYVGMRLAARADGKEVAKLRIMQRFTGKAVVLLELIEGEPPAANARLLEE